MKIRLVYSNIMFNVQTKYPILLVGMGWLLPNAPLLLSKWIFISKCKHQTFFWFKPFNHHDFTNFGFWKKVEFVSRREMICGLTYMYTCYSLCQFGIISQTEIPCEVFSSDAFIFKLWQVNAKVLHVRHSHFYLDFVYVLEFRADKFLSYLTIPQYVSATWLNLSKDFHTVSFTMYSCITKTQLYLACFESLSCQHLTYRSARSKRIVDIIDGQVTPRSRADHALED